MKNSGQIIYYKRRNRVCEKEERILVCLPCEKVWKEREMCPSFALSEVTIGRFGVLIVSGIPLTLRAACNEELEKILYVVAMKNYSDTGGALIYDAETERIWYRVLHSLEEGASLRKVIVKAEIEHAAVALADAYETIFRL